MASQFFENQQPHNPAPDLSTIDINSLPLTPIDPISEYFQPMDFGAWALDCVPVAVCTGYWGELQLAQNLIVLRRRQRVWMSTAPMEIESQKIGVDFARGHVVVFGLGLGWATAMSALKPEVEQVTVVEMDDKVLDMHEQIKLFERLPGGVGEKVRIVHADALEWKPDSHVDLLMPDIWVDMVSWERAEEVHDMQANVGADMVYFWGQELELARHAVRLNRPIDGASLAAMAAQFDLPLVGLDTPDYAARTHAAAREWMKGRWLEGTVVPDDLRSAADDIQASLP